VLGGVVAGFGGSDTKWNGLFVMNFGRDLDGLSAEFLPSGMDFRSVNWDVVRRIDADAYSISLHRNDRNPNVAINDDFFAWTT
jgi:hypothetical protein